MITRDDLPFQRFEPAEASDPAPAAPAFEEHRHMLDAWFHAWALGPAMMLAMLKQLHTDTVRHSRRLPQ